MKKYLLLIVACIAVAGCGEDVVAPAETFKSYTIKSVTLKSAESLYMDQNAAFGEYDDDGTGPDVFIEIRVNDPVTGLSRLYQSSPQFDKNLPDDLPLTFTPETAVTVNEIDKEVWIGFYDYDTNGTPWIGTVKLLKNEIYGKSVFTLKGEKIGVAVNDRKQEIVADIEFQWNK